MKKILFITALLLAGGVAPAQVYRLPCVVHIVYRNAGEDITDAQVKSLLDSVNHNLSGRCANNTVARQIFDTLKADVGVRLCLAAKDTAGAATTGILHVQTSSAPLAGDFNFPRMISQGWDDTRFVNIWICSMGNAIAAGGFTFNSGQSMYMPLHPYGVCINKDISTVPGQLAAVLTHELGHYMGLLHTFDNDDLVDDTPCSTDALSPDFNCQPADLALNTCSTETPYWRQLNPPDMIENFMSYHFDCQKLFTKGQKARVQAFVGANLTAMVNSATTQCGPATSLPSVPDLSSVRLLPNPAKDAFRVEGFSGALDIQVMDNVGRAVLPLHTVRAGTSVGITGLPDGVYFIRLVSGNGQWVTRLLKY